MNDADELQPEGTLALKPEDAQGVAVLLARLSAARQKAAEAQQQAEIETLAFEGLLSRINRAYGVELPVGHLYRIKDETLQWTPLAALSHEAPE